MIHEYEHPEMFAIQGISKQMICINPRARWLLPVFDRKQARCDTLSRMYDHEIRFLLLFFTKDGSRRSEAVSGTLQRFDSNCLASAEKQVPQETRTIFRELWQVKIKKAIQKLLIFLKTN